jgi:O-antigen ligase
MEIVMLFFSVAVIISLISVVITNTRASIGGATYQNVAYIAAFAFGVNLYYIFFGENHERFAFARSKPYYYLCYVLLLFQLSSVIASGGRDGMILVIVYSVYLFLLLLKDKSSYKKLKNISLIILIGIIGMITQLKLLSISIYESSLNRAFSYLSGGDTSGRDTLYNDAMHVILDSPLFGYGLFGMFDYYNDYPHNFFLEVLMQGGLFYLVFWFVIIMYLIIKYINISMKFKAFRLISVIALYPIVVLMVSGTYINQSVFWFIISFIISYKIKLSD